MSSTPSAFSAATERNPIGPPPVTSQRVPGRAPPPCVMPCSATASGSVERGVLRARGRRGRAAPRRRVIDLVAGERALPVARRRRRPGPARRRATAGRRGSTRTRRSAATGPPTTRSPTLQPSTPAPTAATVPENSWPSITSVAAAPLEEEVQVGAADPAVADLEQQLARPGLGRGPVLDRDVPEAHEHRRGHDVGDSRVGHVTCSVGRCLTGVART